MTTYSPPVTLPKPEVNEILPLWKKNFFPFHFGKKLKKLKNVTKSSSKFYLPFYL